MKKQALHKDIKKSITHSFGRFFSIMLLMALGSFALVGLSVTGSNMRETGKTYFNEYNTADITIMSDYGLDETEIKAIESSSGISSVEYIYLKDVTVENENKSFRIFSNSNKISMYELVSGAIPTSDDEIAIDATNEEYYQIGDSITFTEKENALGINVLRTHTFKITGFIKSTEILSTLNRGQTTIGTGSLDCYAIVDKSVFDSSVYMMAKVNFEDTKAIDPYSNEYNDKVILHKKELERLLEDNEEVRFSLIKSEYQDKINESNTKIIDAKTELEDAKTKLDEANTKITDAKSEISSNENKLNSANQELKDAKELLSTKKQELNAKKQEFSKLKQKLEEAEGSIKVADKKLVSAKEQLDSSGKLIIEKEEELNSKKQESNNAQTELDNKKQKLEINKTSLENAKKQYEDGIDELNLSISNIKLVLQNPSLSEEKKEAYKVQLALLESKLTDTTKEYNLFLENTYNPNMTKINQGLKELEVKQKEIDEANELLKNYDSELTKSKQELALKKSEYQKSVKELESAKKEYNQNVVAYNNALEQLKDAEAKILVSESESNAKKGEYTSGVKTLAKAKQELETNEKEYYEKLEEYNSKLPEATEEIENGEKSLEEAKENLDSLEGPTYSVDNRRETPGGEGYGIYETVSDIVDSLADIFPWFMYFVAALVTLTTMTRFVDEERINMGTLKALGYSDKDTIKKFVIYGFLSASIGTVIGIVLGHILISYIVYNAYGSGFTVPTIEIHFYLYETILSCILSMLCSVLPAYLVAKSNLKEKPANLLLPKAPVSGSKILLERNSFIWKRMNFTQKVTARNIFRYKKRMLMTIFGVAGASAILFTGFSVQKSVSTINDKQFQDIIKYDLIVALNDNLKDEKIEEFNELLENDSITGKTSVYYEEASKETGKNNDKQEIKLIVPEDIERFNDYIDLHTRKGKYTISLDDDGVVISERLATSMNVKVGDTFTFEDNKGKTHEVKVSEVCEMYAGHFIFMSKTAYAKTYDTQLKTNAYMLSLNNSSIEYTEKISSEFMNLPATKGIVQNTTMYNMINTIVKSLNKIMLVLIVLAALLSVVILFNLTNINVAERIRELSTIKVLGFRDKEVTMYIYKETIILSQIGIVVGWLFGILLHHYILTVVPPDQVMFDSSLWIGAYIISFSVINVVTFILKFYIHKKLINVDMIEALKSVD